jgi:hypothetical protein
MAEFDDELKFNPIGGVTQMDHGPYETWLFSVESYLAINLWH